jgi:hypothetical protein
MSRARRSSAAKLHREGEYVAWLMQQRDYDMGEAIAYARKGQGGLDKHRVDKEPTLANIRQRPSRDALETDREADMPEDLRRWRRVDRNCPYKGCIYPVNHSGPHQRPSRLREMLENSVAALDERERE